MRFGRKTSAPNYLGRREQRRLLTLILLLGAVFYLMYHAGKPSSWYWFVALSQPVPTQQSPEVETRLSVQAREESLPGAFVAEAENPPTDAADRTLPPGVQSDTLQSIKDDTVFRGAEHEAFYHLLKLLDQTDDATVASWSVGPTAFVQLFEQPDEYRGQIVSLRGTVHRAMRTSAPKNDFGIEHYYQVWLQPYDAPGNPLVIYALDLPGGFPEGMRVHEDIECDAFFFKRWAYQAADDIRSAPLLLAKTLKWQAPVARPGPNVKTIATAVAGALALAACAVWLAVRGGRADNPYASRRAARQAPFVAPEAGDLPPNVSRENESRS